MSPAETLAILPLILLGGTAVLLLLVISFFRNHLAVASLSVAGLLAAGIALFAGGTSVQAGALVSMDPGARFFIAMIVGSSILVALLSFEYLKKSERPEEYYLLLVLATLGSSILASSSDFASFFLGLEILSVSLYALICYPRAREQGLEASIKYVVLAGTSSAFLLFGMALIYDASGSLEFSKIAVLQPGASPSVVWAGTAFLLVGIGFKLALAPFHTWAPDVYEGAPAPISAYIATVSKGAVFAVFLRYLLQARVVAGSPIFIVVAVLAIASMTIGNFLALYQRNIKRLLAYSSTAHLGYLLIALLAGARLGAFAVAFYLAAYFAMTLVAFAAVTSLSLRMEEREGQAGREADDLESYRGLFWREPGLASMLAIAFLSLAGIPLTAGFTAKFFLLRAGIDSHLWLLSIVLVLNSAVALFYYLRVIVMMSSTEGSPTALTEIPRSVRPSRLIRLVMAVSIAAVIWLGVYPSPLISAVQAAVTGFVR